MPDPNIYTLENYKTSPVPAPNKKGNLIKVLVVILVIALLVALGWYLMPYFRTAKTPVTKNELMSLDASIIPSVFPEGFPFPKDATIVQNYEFTDGKSNQGTRKYTTNQTPQESYQLIKNYLLNSQSTISDLQKIDENSYTFGYRGNFTEEFIATFNKQDNGTWLAEMVIIQKIITRTEKIPVPNQ